MKKINVKDYYYLKNSKKINEGEIQNGATMLNGTWVTNYEESTELVLNDTNKLSIYIPSTIDVDKINPNFDELIQNIENKLKLNFKKINHKEKTKGAWKCENNELVFENICILEVISNNDNDINYFISLAKELKKELTQEGISIGVNEGLLII